LRSFDDLFDTICAIMRRDLENRWLLRDYVGLLVAIPALRALHEQMQPAREARIDAVLANLVEAGLLDRERVDRRRPLLRQQFFTQVFFCLPAALVSASARDPAMSLDLHARATLALLQAYCTAAGRRQLEALLDRACPK
jgi:hypothetical protein